MNNKPDTQDKLQLPALREVTKSTFNPEDTLVIFGEVFKGGYVSGLVQEAKKTGMQIIYSTVGRRDPNGHLRALSEEEIARMPKPLINIPLEAGFDMEPADKEGGLRPIDLCQKIRLNEWESATLDNDLLESACAKARLSFESRLQSWLNKLLEMWPKKGNVILAHTMAGGVPRTKILMPVLNRVFKGLGPRFYPSAVFWQTDLGQLCARNFNEVTAQTYRSLLELSAGLRERARERGQKVFYTAYSYHGTEVLIDDEYRWQTYSPYLQGFAKIELENISKQFFKKEVNTCVFNVPEILTKSSAIFPGVEIPLYTLLLALQKDGGAKGEKLAQDYLKHLKPGALEQIKEKTKEYFLSDVVLKNSIFKKWPQHNQLQQMERQLKLSKTLAGLHLREVDNITLMLSELVFLHTGALIFQELSAVKRPVCWLSHDIIARQA